MSSFYIPDDPARVAPPDDIEPHCCAHGRSYDDPCFACESIDRTHTLTLETRWSERHDDGEYINVQC